MSDFALTCANHPGRATTLRCNRCEKPICTRCAVATPVGYRCRECVRGQQVIFETARSYDFLVAAFVTAAGVGVATGLLRLIGIWGLFVAPVVGGGIGEVVRWAVRRRRGRHLPTADAIGGGLGVLPHLAVPAAALLLSVGRGVDLALIGGALLGALWPTLYGALMISTLYYRLRGIGL
jgi:hypothetical protein